MRRIATTYSPGERFERSIFNDIKVSPLSMRASPDAMARGLPRIPLDFDFITAGLTRRGSVIFKASRCRGSREGAAAGGELDSEIPSFRTTKFLKSRYAAI